MFILAIANIADVFNVCSRWLYSVVFLFLVRAHVRFRYGFPISQGFSNVIPVF